MLGIFFGVICLIALVKVVRGPRYWRRGYRGRHGYRGFFLRRLFQRLNTGPGQEKVVLGEVEVLRQTGSELRAELKGVRGDIAAIVRGEHFDRAKVQALYRKQDELLAKLRAAVSGSLEKIHGALDERQKRDLADLVEGGFRHAFYGGFHHHGC